MKPYALLALQLFAASVALCEDHVVAQNNRQFSTAAITIKKGDSLVFKNVDTVMHNVFSMSPVNAFDLRIQQPGTSSSIEFKQAGTTEVRCAIHPGMKIIVTVTE